MKLKFILIAFISWSFVWQTASPISAQRAQTQLERLPPARGIRFPNVRSVRSETARDPEIERALINMYEGYAEELRRNPASLIRYLYNRVDLNGDNQPEVLAFLYGQYVGGTGGYTGVVLQRTQDGYRTVGDISLARNPIVVSDRRTNGWNDLVMYTVGGGAPLNYVAIKFNGQTYDGEAASDLRSNSRIRGTAYLADRATRSTGLALQPPER